MQAELQKLSWRSWAVPGEAALGAPLLSVKLSRIRDTLSSIISKAALGALTLSKLRLVACRCMD
jgi:hypothetical protein